MYSNSAAVPAMSDPPSSIQPTSKQVLLSASVPDGQPSTATFGREQTTASNGPQVTREPPAAFTCFSKLPPELRCKVWREASFQKRNICITIKKLGTWDEDLLEGVWACPFAYISRSTHPAILHTSREARTEGLKYYTLDFGVSYVRPLFTFSSPPRTYINWKADRVCITEPQLLNTRRFNFFNDFINLCKERGLRNIAINVESLRYDDILVAISKGPTSLEQINLFSANRWVINSEVFREDRAALKLLVMSETFIIRAVIRGEGKYNNKGDINWDGMADSRDLERAEKILIRGFEKYEKRLAKQAKSNMATNVAETSRWIRPNVKWSVAKLEFLPGKTIDADMP